MTARRADLSFGILLVLCTAMWSAACSEPGQDDPSNETVTSSDAYPAELSIAPDITFSARVAFSYRLGQDGVELSIDSVDRFRDTRPFIVQLFFETDADFQQWLHAGGDAGELIAFLPALQFSYGVADGVEVVQRLSSLTVSQADQTQVEIQGVFDDGTEFSVTGPTRAPECTITNTSFAVADQTEDCWARACEIGLDSIYDSELACPQ